MFTGCDDVMSVRNGVVTTCVFTKVADVRYYLYSGTMRIRNVCVCVCACACACVPEKCLTQTYNNLHTAFEQNKEKRFLIFETVQYHATFNVLNLIYLQVYQQTAACLGRYHKPVY